MSRRVETLMVSGVVAVLCASCLVPAARAEDFFFGLFGMFRGAPRMPAVPVPFGFQGPQPAPSGEAPRRRITRHGVSVTYYGDSADHYGGSQAWCVRTCDGRYFPVAAAEREGRSQACNKLCPASETKVVYGESIDDASTESGKSYSELPNAFRYRSELVADCTCNGKDQVGLAKIKVEDDPTLRRGDIIAGAKGLVVANSGADRHHATLNVSPVSRGMRSRFRHVPIVAAE